MSGRNKDPRRDGWFRCYLCLESKPGTEFHASRARWNGLSNRCKDCERVIIRLYIQARRTGKDTSAAYQKAVALCKEARS